MTVTLKEEGPNVLISPTRYSLEEFDNVLHKWKTSGEFDNLPQAEQEMMNRVRFNPVLKFRIIKIEPNETELVATSDEEIANADSLDDADGAQAI